MTTTPAPQPPITDRLGAGTSCPPIGWIELGIALLAALVTYGVGIGVIWAMRDASFPAAGIVQYLVSGLASLVAVGTVALLRTRSLRPLGWQAVQPRWARRPCSAGCSPTRSAATAPGWQCSAAPRSSPSPTAST